MQTQWVALQLQFVNMQGRHLVYMSQAKVNHSES